MITLVVGAQYGGEGKGKVAGYLATRESFFAACRTGGVNSSHTIRFGPTTVRLRMLPAAALVDPDVQVIFGAGALIHIPTLLSEMSEHKVWPKRIMIDGRAGIISETLIDAQRSDPRYQKIGSTLTGTGYAAAARAKRQLSLAYEYPNIADMVSNEVVEFLHDASHKGRSMLLEGHQAFGLSNYHGDYPYVSSRDCTAAEMLSELGLGVVSRTMRIVLAVKAFPTRNHEGALPHELSKKEIARYGIRERGGGSWGIEDRERRVGRIDMDVVIQAVRANGATEIALTGVDYLDHRMQGARSVEAITYKVFQFLSMIERATGVWVRYLSTGPDVLDMIDRGAP